MKRKERRKVLEGVGGGRSIGGEWNRKTVKERKRRVLKNMSRQRGRRRRRREEEGIGRNRRRRIPNICVASHSRLSKTGSHNT